MPATEKRIYKLVGFCVLLVVAAILIPRFAPDSGGGFAGATNAVLVFFVILHLALAFSIYVLAVTLGSLKQISKLCKIAGIAPSVILFATLVGLFGFLQY